MKDKINKIYKYINLKKKKKTAPSYRKHTEFPLHFPLVNAVQGNNPNCIKLTCYKIGKTNGSIFVAAW